MRDGTLWVAVDNALFKVRPQRKAPERVAPCRRAHCAIARTTCWASPWRRAAGADCSSEMPCHRPGPVTVPRPTASNPPPPADIVVDDGDPADSGDARIAIRFQKDRSLMMLQLAPAPGGGGPTVRLRGA